MVVGRARHELLDETVLRFFTQPDKFPYCSQRAHSWRREKESVAAFFLGELILCGRTRTRMVFTRKRCTFLWEIFSRPVIPYHISHARALRLLGPNRGGIGINDAKSNSCPKGQGEYPHFCRLLERLSNRLSHTYNAHSAIFSTQSSKRKGWTDLRSRWNKHPTYASIQCVNLSLELLQVYELHLPVKKGKATVVRMPSPLHNIHNECHPKLSSFLVLIRYLWKWSSRRIDLFHPNHDSHSHPLVRIDSERGKS